MQSWKEFKYKNLSLVLVGLVLAFWITDYPPFQDLLLRLRELKFLGAFLGGILFVSTFTFGIGTVILVSLAETSSLFILAIFAGLGGVVGDLLIFRFVKDRLMDELRPFYQGLGNTRLGRIFYSQFFAWTLPVIGAIIIASPLPDELGVSLMGISNISTYKFTIISFVLNTVGIFVILMGYQTIAA